MIGQRIKELRQKKGYSLTELAALAEVSKSYLSYIERNLQNNPSLQFLSKLVIPLNTSIEYLLGNEGSNEKIDEEWKALIQDGIKEGLSKEDFAKFKEFVRFKKWNKERREELKENDYNRFIKKEQKAIDMFVIKNYNKNCQ